MVAVLLAKAFLSTALLRVSPATRSPESPPPSTSLRMASLPASAMEAQESPSPPVTEAMLSTVALAPTASASPAMVSLPEPRRMASLPARALGRQSVGEGRRGSERVGHGGRRHYKKNKQK